MIAYDSTGSILALADGAELLVHDGPSEGPLWRRTGDTPLAGIGAAAGAVIAVDRAGRATWNDPRRDHVLAHADAGVQVHAAAVSHAGDLLLATDDGARVLTRRGPGPALPLPNARVVAWSTDGRMLVAAADGQAAEFDPTGHLLRTIRLDGPAVAAAWNPQGFWILATAKKLVRLVDGALHHLTSGPDDIAVTHVACSAAGDRIALGLGDDLLIVLAWPSRDSVGQLRYIDRKLTGVAFGPAPWLGVGMDQGDGNKLNLTSGALNRTDTHPGREHHRWLVKVSVDPPAAASEPAPPAAPPAPERAAYSPPSATERKAGMSPLGVAIILLLVLLPLLAVLAF